MTTSERIKLIKGQIAHMRAGLPYIDSAASRGAEQARIRELECELKELQGDEAK